MQTNVGRCLTADMETCVHRDADMSASPGGSAQRWEVTKYKCFFVVLECIFFLENGTYYVCTEKSVFSSPFFSCFYWKK